MEKPQPKNKTGKDPLVSVLPMRRFPDGLLSTRQIGAGFDLSPMTERVFPCDTVCGIINSMSGRYRAVIDTNVLYAGLYSATGASYRILRSIEKGRIIPLLSTTLLLEYEELLKRKQGSLMLMDQEIDDVLDGLCSRAETRKAYFLWRPQLSDPKDDHVLELAVASGRVDIVTHDVKDFSRASSFGIRAVRPAELLAKLRFEPMKHGSV
uniref:Putative toxin-antitoxin system toxin component, PIN family n=1 Tax=Candidatus Kentrum sp. LFY TaxID=2126342 RepID=A0A450U4Q6_9GAMM|nr:MAG: putative toxin-antitoxin system toxin component, PIN family [Candidatus Kentron sp. LFY]